MQDEGTYDPVVRIVEYAPWWARAFQWEAEIVRRVLKAVAVRIDHVGSTSVPGLDLMGSYRGPLEALGYLFVPDTGSPGLHLSGKLAQQPRIHHVHVSEMGSVHEQGDLAFQEYLRTPPERGGAVHCLQAPVGSTAPGNPLAYIASKDPFVIDMKKHALILGEGDGESALRGAT